LKSRQNRRSCATRGDGRSRPGPGIGRFPEHRATETTLRWIMLHMIEETARHAGHMDAIRELLDGQKGYY
jgi:uncharacterized protein DUF664